MRKTILDLLKAKFEGVSEAILGRVADKLAKTATTEEQAKTAVEGVTFSSILESYGDSRATEAQQTAVSNYEKKHGLKDGVKVDNSGGAPDPSKKNEPTTKTAGDDMPDWAKALIESNNKLNERLNNLDRDRTTASRKKQLMEVVNKLPENLRKAYERTSVDSLKDEEFSSLLEEITTEVEGIVTETQQKGALFGRPTNPNASTNKSGVKEASEEEVKAVVDRMVV